jgi:hypothetical protein
VEVDVVTAATVVVTVVVLAGEVDEVDASLHAATTPRRTTATAATRFTSRSRRRSILEAW